MILGTGIDIVKVERIRRAVERTGQRFLKKIFTEAELDHCMKRRDPYPSLAVRFAAKEACIKALSDGSSVVLSDVEVVNAPSGKPAIRVTNRLQVALDKAAVRRVHISLSHEREYAVAMVVLEG